MATSKKRPSRPSKSPARSKKATTATAKKKAPTAKKSPARKTSGAKAPATSAARKKKAPATAASKKAPAKRKAPAAAKKAPAAAKKAPARKRGTFDAKFLAEQKEALLTERANYLRQAADLQREADSLTENREPGDVQFDEESGEGDTLAVERERDLALSAKAREMVEEIDAALTRITDGTYGICRVSGEPIPKERLRAIPWAAERVEHKVGGFARR